MKQMDKDGLLLCTLQGNIFASSLENTDSSSEIFMRRFMMSKLVTEFDLKAVLDDSLTIKETFEIIENEFGKTSYGKVKYNKEVLFWIGYLYRYMAYTYDLSSKYIYKIIKPKELNERYYVYHTFDCAQAIERILEEKNISFDEEKQNERLFHLMRRVEYEKEVRIVPQNLKQETTLMKDFKIDDFQFRNNEFVFKEKTTPYMDMKEKEEYELLSIIYKENIISEIHFKGNSNVYELEIVWKDEKYKNNEMVTVALEKSLEYAKNDLGIQEIVVNILKKDDELLQIFQKLGFKYAKESDGVVSYSKWL